MGSDEIRFNFSLFVRGKFKSQGQCPQVTNFKKRGQMKWIWTKVLLLTSLTPCLTARPSWLPTALDLGVKDQVQTELQASDHTPSIAFRHLPFLQRRKVVVNQCYFRFQEGTTNAKFSTGVLSLDNMAIKCAFSASSEISPVIFAAVVQYLAKTKDVCNLACLYFFNFLASFEF